VFPPAPSLRLIADMIAWSVAEIPKWNPINICSYHLQEAGATPAQELAYALSTAIAVLDAVRDAGKVPPERFPDVVARISFFVNAGLRFVEEMCKMRAFAALWDEITRERYGVDDARKRRLRYGVQVNSLGLTESQPENNVQRIVLEMLAVTLSRDARARAIQLPAWNEALGLPRPWDQQWSLRIQQVMAFETDLLEYDRDIFEGSVVVEDRVAALMAEVETELARIESLGGAAQALDVMKQALVASHAARQRRIESKDLTVVGVNAYTEHEPSPLTAGAESILTVDAANEREQIERLRAFRAQRNAADVAAAIKSIEDAARSGANILPASIRAAQAGVTTGEWSGTLRRVFGEYRAPTGLAGATAAPVTDSLTALRKRTAEVASQVGHPLRLLVGKPGLDGHSNGAEQVAVRAKDAGFEVIYQGIRLTPEQIVVSALEEDVDAIGLSIHSGSHMTLVPRITELLRQRGAQDLPVVVGGIIPHGDRERLQQAGVARVYTPGESTLTAIIGDLVEIIAASHARAA
jgi:(2R)-ethylmalonyl-CoA mutase